MCYYSVCSVNPLNPELTVVIYIHYKPPIAVAIPDLQWMKMTWSWVADEKNILLLLKHFHENFSSKTPRY